MGQGQSCVTFNVGNVSVDSDTITSNVSEHRNVCVKDGNITFEYGTAIGNRSLMFIGSSLKPEDKLEKYEFLIHTFVDDKQVSETEVNAEKVGELFEDGPKSKLFLGTVTKYNLKTSLKTIKEDEDEDEDENEDDDEDEDENEDKDDDEDVSKKIQVIEKQKFKPASKPGYVINPLTGAEIKIDGPTYMKLCQTDDYVC